MKVEWAVVCRASSLDVSGTLSVFHIVGGVGVNIPPPLDSDINEEEGPPIIGDVCEFVAILSPSDPTVPENLHIRINFIHPDSEINATMTLDDGVVHIDQHRVLYRVGLPGIPFLGYGNCRFVIEEQRISDEQEEWYSVHEVPFDVMKSDDVGG